MLGANHNLGKGNVDSYLGRNITYVLKTVRENPGEYNRVELRMMVSLAHEDATKEMPLKLGKAGAAIREAEERGLIVKKMEPQTGFLVENGIPPSERYFLAEPSNSD
jgi:hypothetical protein